MPRKLNMISFASIIVGFCLSSFGQEATPKPDEPAVVSLIDAGSEPKIKLRMTPAKGTKQTSIMTMKMDQTIVMSGQDLPATPTPAMQFTIEVAVTDVASNGDFTFEYAYPKVGLVDDESAPSLVKQTMKSMLKSIEGMSGSAVMSNRGFTQKSDMNLPPKSNAQVKAMIDSMKESMSRLSAPLPEEAIGAGGKWSVTQLVEVNGMKLKQTSIHTLKKIDGEKYDISVEVTQSAEKQEVKTPGLPVGATVKLKSLGSTGKGTMKLDANQLLPVSEMKSDSKINMEMNAAGQQLPMQVDMKSEMKIGPAKAVEE
jgi:Family of unknown function (DUF6263)